MSSQEVLNETLDYISSSNLLSENQTSRLFEMSSESGVQCLLQMWLNYSYVHLSNGLYCNATWDNVYCWPPIPAGKEITRPCSETFHDMNPYYASHMEGNARRVCLSNGSWATGNKTDYSECADSYKAYLKREEEDVYLEPIVQYMLFFGSILSLLCLGVSLVLFYHFRSLWCDRTVVNVHLMMALVLRFIFLFIIAEPHVLGRTDSYRNVEYLCESVLVIFLYATVATIFWMFIQGLFLNISLTPRFAAAGTTDHLKIYYILGWVAPGVITLAYVIAMLLKEKQEHCWNGYLDMDEMWILVVPIMAVLVVNGLFLINILRVILAKIRNSTSRSQTSQIRAAAKATALLFPVLGINNLLFFHNPGGEFHKYFVVLNTFFGSTQGVFVALVYCFNNKEMHGAIKRCLDRAKQRREANLSQVHITNCHRSQGNVGIMEMPTHVQGNATTCTSKEEAV